MLFTIQDVLNTLNSVEVHGKDNLDKMLGVILALEAMLEAEKKEGHIELPQPTGELSEAPVEETKIYADEE